MDYIPRKIGELIESELASNKILIITGPRQAGKTTLLKQISDKLEKDKSQKGQVFYYNFDRIADLEFFNKQQKVEAFLSIRSLKSRLYIFIDEVQRKKDAGNFFKYFYDAGLNVKFIFSGSSSVELTDSFGDALTGRKVIFNLPPLSVAEIAGHTLAEEFEYAKLGEPTSLEKLRLLVEDVLIWGAYPEVNKHKLESKKLRALGELYESYVQKDVKDLLRVKNVSGFNHLVKLLAHMVGEPIVVEDLVRQTGMHANTVNSYLDILEGTMIISRTENYNPDFDDKLPKSKRFYFLDNGMRNYSLNLLQTDFRTDYQQLVANLIYAELFKAKESETIPGIHINHYQTYSDNHVDFIISNQTDDNALPILVRYQDNSDVLGKKAHEFINTQQPKKLIIVTKDLQKEITVKGTEVRFEPLERFIVELAQIINVAKKF